MKNTKSEEQCIEDGAIYESRCTDARLKIECTELIKFHCIFSLLALCEPGLLGNRVYCLDAVLENGIVKCCFDWHCEGKGEKINFDSDVLFMNKLQEIIVKYDLAKYNGYTCTVSGLPDMYGAKIDVGYKTGEYIYANDNQDCFLPMEMMEETVKTFRDACEK